MLFNLPKSTKKPPALDLLAKNPYDRIKSTQKKTTRSVSAQWTRSGIFTKKAFDDARASNDEIFMF